MRRWIKKSTYIEMKEKSQIELQNPKHFASRSAGCASQQKSNRSYQSR